MIYNWRSKYAGLEVNEAKRLRKLEVENNKLKMISGNQGYEGFAVNKVVIPTARKEAARHLVDYLLISVSVSRAE